MDFPVKPRTSLDELTPKAPIGSFVLAIAAGLAIGLTLSVFGFLLIR
jgi:hypothetical protein